MFVLKKFLTLALMPLSIGLAAVWAGVICWWLNRKPRVAKLLVSGGILLLTLFSFHGIANRVINPLEMCYPPLVDTTGLGQIKWVVVLAGGQAPEEGLPANLQLGGSTLARLVEGIRIQRALSESKLLLSGGAVFDPVPVAETMAAAALMLGVPADRIELETLSRDTAEQAGLIRSIVNEDRFVLVTSAIHMPRSMQLFEQQGMQPVPGPAEFTGRKIPGFIPSHFFPRASELGKVESALHEYLGLAWSVVTGAR
jgi:uncharacterized SAM-binding protein YcdF (DUF218 family)